MDPQGRVAFNAMGDRQVVRVEPDGRRTGGAAAPFAERPRPTYDEFAYERP